MSYTVKTATKFKEGMGANGPWTLYKLTLENDPQEPTGFEYVTPGDQVDIEQKETTKNGKTYKNLQYTKVEGAAAAPAASAAAPASAPAAGASDKRVLSLLVLVAEQIGVDKDEIMKVLQG